MPDKKSILDYTFTELKKELVDKGFPQHRANQLFNWVYRKFNFDFLAMSDLPKDLRPQLAQDYCIHKLELTEVLESKDNETIKFLFKTHDGHYIESVIIMAEDDSDDEEGTRNSKPRLTLCVSSQCGCPLGCKFCATGLLGYKRNLTSGEIISQVLLVESWLKAHKKSLETTERQISNIVFMGMGEPLLNLEQVMKAIVLLNFSGGYNLGGRHFTLSTAGLIEQIRALAFEKIQLRLALSLHSVIQEQREELMPVAKANKLPELISAIKDYQSSAARRVTMEYIMIPGVNMAEKDAETIRKVLAGLDYNLNLIPYNPLEELPYKAPSDSDIRLFQQHLRKYGIPAVLRKSKGRDIKAGCGQLGLYWTNKELKSC